MLIARETLSPSLSAASRKEEEERKDEKVKFNQAAARQKGNVAVIRACVTSCVQRCTASRRASGEAPPLPPPSRKRLHAADYSHAVRKSVRGSVYDVH